MKKKLCRLERYSAEPGPNPGSLLCYHLRCGDHGLRISQNIAGAIWRRQAAPYEREAIGSWQSCRARRRGRCSKGQIEVANGIAK